VVATGVIELPGEQDCGIGCAHPNEEDRIACQDMGERKDNQYQYKNVPEAR
jgi:hypothetical protein